MWPKASASFALWVGRAWPAFCIAKSKKEAKAIVASKTTIKGKQVMEAESSKVEYKKQKIFSEDKEVSYCHLILNVIILLIKISKMKIYSPCAPFYPSLDN